MNTPILQLLQNAASGLLFISETDAPLLPFFWPDDNTQLTPQLFAQLLAASRDAAKTTNVDANVDANVDVNIEVVTLQHFFRNATRQIEEHDVEEHDVEEVARAERFRALSKTLENHLDNVQVFRVGEIAIDVYIIGATQGGFAGLQTKVVET